MAQYQSYSPFARTQTVNDQYLDLLSIRPIPATADDVLNKRTVPVAFMSR